ncbi:MAG: serine/threonine protein phosphatase [Candidatus Aegiribacteria sp.]|nr:serine/threonine protein phosphatase [Candidatus Aegiribacteria sp.]MBD3294040.1 serine/threonine protein phosphatase [Candidatus Fermentibacteria bacterium]
MGLFALGDLHLSLSSSKPMDIFGDHWQQHHLKILRNWRKIVGEDDTVLIPGDISWAMSFQESMEDLEWIRELPGRKILIKGNHDYWWPSISKLRSFLKPNMVPLQHNAAEAEGCVITGTRGWLTPESEGFHEESDGKVFRRELIRLRMGLEAADKLRSRGQSLIAMMHYPPLAAGIPTEFCGLMEEFGVDTCVYGHIHMAPGEWPGNLDLQLNGTSYILVSADYLDFNPLRIGE